MRVLCFDIGGTNVKYGVIEKEQFLEKGLFDTDAHFGKEYMNNKLITIAKEMKEKGIFPVYVNLEEDFCGGCKVELPLNFKEKLKLTKLLPCEHCGRIIMFENK